VNATQLVAVVIPCYKVRLQILEVLAEIGPEVDLIYVVDDACPEHSGQHVETHCTDPRVQVLRHSHNQGVGGAVKTGYRAAAAHSASVIVKLDGDGQMDPTLIPAFIAPILAGEADYTKGNRFFDLEDVRTMPSTRIFGNVMLSLMSKLSSGYWDIFDPTNGYTALHSEALTRLPLDKIGQRYFFESDMLFRLGTVRAVVVDVPMVARYGSETSNLVIHQIVGDFLLRHLKCFYKRIFYSYFLRDMSLASLELPLGALLLLFGLIFGSFTWIGNAAAHQATPAGTVMVAALPIIIGIQLLLAFVGHDVAAVPRRPLQRRALARPSLPRPAAPEQR
jgi:dolichol-phosphate mannosyltransferase